MRFAANAVRLLLLVASTVGQASSHRPRVYPNTSLTILSIAQAPDGFLWLAADDGVYRFDGFHFQKIADFPLPSARKIVSTGDGSLWISSAKGLVRYQQRFTVVLQDDVAELAALPNDVIVKFNARDNALVHVDGSVQRFTQYARRDLTVDFLNRIWFFATDPATVLFSTVPTLGPSQKVAIPVPGTFNQAATDGRGVLWIASNDRAIGLQAGNQVGQFSRKANNAAERARPLFPGRKGQVWFLGETIQGMAPPQVFRDRKEFSRLPVTAAFEDARGHLWAAVAGRGLVEWIPDANWNRWFPEDFGSQGATQVIRTNQREMLAAAGDGLFRLGADRLQWSSIPGSVHGVKQLFPKLEGGFLASLERTGVANMAESGTLNGVLPNPTKSDDFRRIARDRQGRLWVGHASGLFRIEAGQLRKAVLPVETKSMNATDLEVASDGKLWVGYENGIAWLDDDNQWHQLRADVPLKGVFSFLPPDPTTGDIWLALAGKGRGSGQVGGRFGRLKKAGESWTWQEFTVKDGYSQPVTRFLKRDSRGWIWRASPDGVRVSNGKDIGPNDWLHIGALNGLAAEGVHPFGFFEDTDGSVWLSGFQGTTHLRPAAGWFEVPHDAGPPRVSRMEADGKPFNGTGETVPRLLRIEVGTFDSSPFREIPLRYRLRPGSDDWRFSRDGVLEFRNLTTGAYQLEVAYAGTGTSPTLRFAFQAGPARPAISWLWALGMLALGTVALLARRFLVFDGFREGKLTARAAAPQFLMAEADPPPEIIHETSLGRYQLLRVVSRSGFSIVYQANDRVTGSEAAVKVISVTARDQAWVRDKFAREIATLRLVNHPGVVPILDSWVNPSGEPGVAMPFLQGHTLREVLTAGRLGNARVAKIVRELGSALAEVHAHGIVHRDLKPENMILAGLGTDEERPVLIDFGLASLRGGLWNPTLLSDSFHYMAPERLTGHYSKESDVYAFGVIILEMLSGKRLPDLKVMVADEAFPAALSEVLVPVVGAAVVGRLVAKLCEAYSPVTRRRPADVRLWADEVADLLAWSSPAGESGKKPDGLKEESAGP